MLNAGLVGIGGMGRGHLDNLIRFTNENQIIRLVALCDINPDKFGNAKVDFNIKGMGQTDHDLSKFRCYTSIDKMIEEEKGKIDFVILALPTFLHCENTVKFLKAGFNVFCEKPMGLNVAQCQLMIDTAEACGKRLMIGQCLRFWGEYVGLKQIVESKVLGEVITGYFYRGGGGAPEWSFINWLRHRECGGGALHDQHVHDVDMVHWLFGMPKAVSSLGKVVYAGSGHDSVATNYIYDSGAVITACDDWSMKAVDFSMEYRVNFEKGAAIWNAGGFKVLTNDGKDITPEIPKETGYYNEMVYFADLISNPSKENTVNPPTDSRDTIKIVVAETKSADAQGAVTEVEQ